MLVKEIRHLRQDNKQERVCPHVNHSILPDGVLGMKVCIATALLSFDFVLKTYLRCSSVLELLHSLCLALGLLSRTTTAKSQ